MALRQITTQPRPSASDAIPIACVPGIPISCAVTRMLGVADVRRAIDGPLAVEGVVDLC